MRTDVRTVLKSVFKRKAVVQAEIARRAGLTPDQLSAVINKRRRLEAGELFRICDALDMSPDELFATDDDQKTA